MLDYIISFWKKTAKVIMSIVLQIKLTDRKMIMSFPGTGNRNETIFPVLKMLEELVPIITQKLPRLSGTSLKTIS